MKENNMTLTRFWFIFKGGKSKRFHTESVLQEQDIAAHSFGVAWCCEIITGGKASKNLIMAALAHDLAEHKVGDMPSPAKRKYDIGNRLSVVEEGLLLEQRLAYYNDLTQEEEKVLKFADLLDGLLYCYKEKMLGNNFIDEAYQNFYSYLHQMNPPEYSFVRDIMEDINARYYHGGKLPNEC